jgi:hypothetical protein
MNGLEILAGDDIRRDARVAFQVARDIAYQILDELRVVVGALGDVFFVRALEQSVQLAGRRSFGDRDQIVGLEMRGERGRDGHGRALVVGTVVRNFLRARAQAGHRHGHLHRKSDVVHAALGAQTDVVIHQTLDVRHRRPLGDEIGKAQAQCAAFCVEPVQHQAHQAGQGCRAERRVVSLQYFQKARHVRAFDCAGKSDRHFNSGNGGDRHTIRCQNPNRVAQSADAHLVDGNRAMVRHGLDVGQEQAFGSIHCGRSSFGLESAA